MTSKLIQRGVFVFRLLIIRLALQLPFRETPYMYDRGVLLVILFDISATSYVFSLLFAKHVQFPYSICCAIVFRLFLWYLHLEVFDEIDYDNDKCMFM